MTNFGSRRSWGRQARAFVRSALSIFESKSRDANGAVRYSQFRIVLFGFAVMFVTHWPATWDKWSVLALAVLVLALPVEDLFRKVPVADAMDAQAAVFSGAVAKGASKVRQHLDTPEAM